MDFETAKEKLNCPHGNCDYYNERYELEAAGQESKLTLFVECMNCQGRDHFLFDVEEYDMSGKVSDFHVGQEITIKDRILGVRGKEGDKAVITAIAAHPLRDDTPVTPEKEVVGVRIPREGTSYSSNLFDLDRLRTLVEKDKIQLD